MGTAFIEPSIASEQSFMCMPVGDEITAQMMSYPMDLPDSFLDECYEKVLAGDREILIDGGEIIEGVVFIPEGANIELVGGQNRIVQLFENYKTRKVLILRVSTTDASPTLSAQQMRDETFGSQDMTLRSQYMACSSGKLTFDPVSNSLAPGISDGVLEIDLDMTAANSTRQQLSNAAIALLEKDLGESIENVLDNVMICHPPGTKGNWAAYAFKNNPISVYNDLWCGYISATMHEVGHNIGFLHSNEDGPYGDISGYMGPSYGTPGWPRLCFNAHKNWQSGWFEDRVVTVDPNAGLWYGKLATFVDYSLTSPGENVVIQVGALYLQFNRAKGPNAQTRERQDQLAIVEERTDGSESLAGIDGRFYNTTVFNLENFGANNETLFIAVCSTHLGDNITVPDMMFVSIGLDKLDCAAPETGAPTDSPAPSPSPSKSPTSMPTESPAPSPSPSMSPSTPTSSPSASPTRHPTVSPNPTTGPPSPSPSWIEPDRGQVCEDDMDGRFYVGEDIGNQTCKWLQETPGVQPFLCIDGLDAWDVCPETCGKCSDACEDDDAATFGYNGTVVNCEWIRDQDPSEWESMCEWQGPYSSCFETCNSCQTAMDTADNCDDDQGDTFFVPGVGKRRCAWLSAPSQTAYLPFFCIPQNPVFHLCAETCGKCFDSCKDDTAAEFTYNGNARTCTWLATKPLQWQAACRRDDIDAACPETCESCP